ncbi:sensor histidine kinase [Salibaculum halophilum]|uniref:sensor histidine kinase n=1 Tax=Salibaculum halophilum TaxID=1914408 RepID=UPI00117AB94F|nr:ATP-binding protein [Salibaculum halophilum]
MRARFTPVLILAPALVLAALGALGAVLLALDQPWAGIDLAVTGDGQDIVLADVDRAGPNDGLAPGGRLLALATADGAARIEPRAADLAEEPDVADSFDALDGVFLVRQGRLHDILASGRARATLAPADGPDRTVTLATAPARPIGDLPVVFWVQVLVAVTGLVMGTWVWSLRAQDLAAFMFALAGWGLALSALCASVYSTREVAMPEGLFRVLSNLNNAGALTFGAGMIGLLLRYPARLVGMRATLGPAVVLAAFVAADMLRLGSGPAITRYLPIVLSMVAIVACLGLQTRATRGDPRGRATLRWLGLSILAGAGAFTLTIIVPQLLGADVTLSQGYAFLFFLLIYAGLAFGVRRTRLFNLEKWAFRILFTMVAVVLIVGLDAVLVLALSVDRGPALSLSFVAVTLAYLPFREAIWRWIFTPVEPQRQRLFSQIVDIALTPPGGSQAARWRALLADLFHPLHIEEAGRATGPGARLDEGGLVLSVPAAGRAPALRLSYAGGGRRLFRPRDVTLVDEMVAMLAHAGESGRAYEKGVAEERARISRDMHDNIGAQLLSALHSAEAPRKDGLIREALSELRAIINAPSAGAVPLDEILANLRAETADRLEAAGIALGWQVTGAAGAVLAPQQAHALRSVLREAVSNVIRHAGAGRVDVDLAATGAELEVRSTDDGRGFDAARTIDGHGLANMRSRIEGLGGAIEIAGAAPGTRLCARLPGGAMQEGGRP